MCKTALVIIGVTFSLGLLTGMLTIFRGTNSQLLSADQPFNDTEYGAYDSIVELCDDASAAVDKSLGDWLETAKQAMTEAYNDQL